MHSNNPIPHRGRSLVWLVARLSILVVIHVAEAARGRPYFNAAGTTFAADNGNLIRGAIVSTGIGNVPSLSQVRAIKNYGLNAIHCHAERSDYGCSAGAEAAAMARLDVGAGPAQAEAIMTAAHRWVLVAPERASARVDTISTGSRRERAKRELAGVMDRP